MLIQDIRYALRSFLRAPGFTLVALLTLALGIGGTTAIFSIVDGVVLRPLPYPDSGPHRPARIASHANGEPRLVLGRRLSRPQEGRDDLSAVAGYRSDIVDLTGRGEPVRITAWKRRRASSTCSTRRRSLGRTYHEATDKPGAAVAVIGEAIWRQQFGGDPAVIGTQVRLNGTPTEIIGVVPGVAASSRRRATSGCWRRSTCRRRRSADRQRDDQPRRAVLHGRGAHRRATGSSPTPRAAEGDRRADRAIDSPGQRRQLARGPSRWPRAWSPTCAPRCWCCSAPSGSCC